MFALSLRRVALPFLGLSLSVLTLAGIAAAQYPPAVGSGQVSRSTLKRCQCTQFTGDGFVPGERVTVTDNGKVVATVTVGRDGAFRVKVCFDERTAEGRHELRGAGASRAVSSVADVRGDTCFARDDEVHAGTFDRIPTTGTGIAIPALLTGFGAVTTGSAALYAARRRRRAAWQPS